MSVRYLDTLSDINRDTYIVGRIYLLAYKTNAETVFSLRVFTKGTFSLPYMTTTSERDCISKCYRNRHAIYMLWVPLDFRLNVPIPAYTKSISDVRDLNTNSGCISHKCLECDCDNSNDPASTFKGKCNTFSVSCFC